MTDPIRQACRYDLAFPFHGAESATGRLDTIARYIDEAGLGRDFYAAGTGGERLERRVADLFGFEAALWCPTGTMAQAIALRIHGARTGRTEFLAHPSSHLLVHEEDGYRHAAGFTARVTPSWSGLVEASDLVPDLACAFVELPQRHNGGRLPDREALDAIKRTAAGLGVPLHLDGARIWTCRPFYGVPDYREIVAGFDSVYVSLYKDIGAIGGAVLLGTADFIAEARTWRTRLGGLMVEPWPMIADALRLLDIRLDQFDGFVHRARQLAALIPPAPGVALLPDRPHVNMFHLCLDMPVERAQSLRDAVARDTGVWLGSRFWNHADPDRSDLEITVGETAMQMPDAVFEDAIHALLRRMASD